MLYGDYGKEIQGRGGVCICLADSLFCTAKSNTTMYSNHTLITMKNKRKKRDENTLKVELMADH